MMAWRIYFIRLSKRVEIVVTSQADTEGFIHMAGIEGRRVCSSYTCVVIPLRISGIRSLQRVGIFDNQTTLAGRTSPGLTERYRLV